MDIPELCCSTLISESIRLPIIYPLCHDGYQNVSDYKVLKFCVKCEGAANVIYQWSPDNVTPGLDHKYGLIPGRWEFMKLEVLTNWLRIDVQPLGNVPIKLDITCRGEPINYRSYKSEGSSKTVRFKDAQQDSEFSHQIPPFDPPPPPLLHQSVLCEKPSVEPISSKLDSSSSQQPQPYLVSGDSPSLPQDDRSDHSAPFDGTKLMDFEANPVFGIPVTPATPVHKSKSRFNFVRSKAKGGTVDHRLPGLIPKGSLFYGKDTNCIATLPIGNDGEVLTVLNGQLVWLPPNK